MSPDEAMTPDVRTRKTILDTLAKYGDSLLDDDAYRRKRKKKAKSLKRPATELVTTEPGTAPRRHKKRNKGQKSSNSKEDPLEADGGEGLAVCGPGGGAALCGERRHLEQLRQKLGLTNLLDHVREKQEKNAGEGEKEAQKAKGTRPTPEVIVFEDPAKRNQNKPKQPLPIRPPLRHRLDSGSDSDSDSAGAERGLTDRKWTDRTDRPARDPNLFDMRSAKHDVQMFGIRGMQRKDKDKAKLEVMMKLGAKPPKNPKVNYRELQVKLKQEKVERTAQRELERAMGNKVSKSNNRKRKQRDSNDIGSMDGQVGRYKLGAQILSKQDIHKVRRQGGAWGGNRKRR